jgi:hypothetical protein
LYNNADDFGDNAPCGGDVLQREVWNDEHIYHQRECGTREKQEQIKL